MESSKFLYIPALIIFMFSFSVISGGGEPFLQKGDEDSIVKRTDNYINYMNRMAAHGDQYMKTYAKISGHSKFRAVTNSGHWPDGIESTVNVVSYKGEPAEYAETPVSGPNASNIEYDNYYYNGKILAYRYFEVFTHSDCTGGSLTNSVTQYYDSTGKYVKTIHVLFDANNHQVDPQSCPSAHIDLTHIYKTYSDTPLAKEGIEGKGK